MSPGLPVQKFLKLVLRCAQVAGILLLVAIAIGGIVVSMHKYERMLALEHKCHVLRAQVDAKQHEIHTIKVNQGRLQTDAEYVARIAHQNRRVFPNELVFVFDAK